MTGLDALKICVVAGTCAMFSIGGLGVALADTPRWKEQPALETIGWLPGAAEYSPDGKLLVLGGAAGEAAAFDPANRSQVWKASVGGGFAAVAFASDGKTVFATFKDGVQSLDAATGQRGIRLEEKGSGPTAVGVFPERIIVVDPQQKLISHKVIFGNARGYFVKTWIKLEGVGGIQLNNVADGHEPADPEAVPLAVDPAGRSAVITGPRSGETGKNVLWAWVAGDYEQGSPGNRLLVGHLATVVSAAWSRDGQTVATGDANGRVILWDAATMKETRRCDLGQRISAVALSNDGKQVAAVAIGKQAKFHAWETADERPDLTPLAVDSLDFSGPVCGCIAFSPDSRQLVASAINLAWLARSGTLIGKLHVWEANGN